MYILKNLHSYFVKKLLVIVSFLQISTTLLVISVYIEWQSQICCGQNYTLVFIYQNQCDNLVWPSTMSELEDLNLSRAATGMWCTHMQKMTELACMLCSGISQMFSSPSRISHTPSLCPFFFFRTYRPPLLTIYWCLYFPSELMTEQLWRGPFKSVMGDAVCKRLQSDRVQNKEDSQRKTGSYESHFHFPSLPLKQNLSKNIKLH